MATNALTTKYEEICGHPLLDIPNEMPPDVTATVDGAGRVSITGKTPLDLIDISEDGTFYGYEFIDKKTGETRVIALSDFVMQPIATIKVTGDEAQTVFLVRVFAYGHAPEGEELQVSAALFSNAGAFQKWCNMRRFQWNGGGGGWLKFLFNRLNMSVVPELRGVTVTGLHDNAIVQEESVFGEEADQYAYVRPKMYTSRPIDIREHKGILVFDAEGRFPTIGWDNDVDEIGILTEWDRGLEALCHLHNPDIMTPILGWMAVAPLRSLFGTFGFPVLAVMGGAGWGKTTLVETCLGAFGYYTSSIGMKGSTRYGVLSAVSSTNAFPVWVDEYRGAIRSEAKDCVDQAVRDAWDASITVRGGTNQDDLSAVAAVRISAPIVVSGEDRFTAQSHIERALLMDIPREGRNPEALRTVDSDAEYFGTVRAGLQAFFSLYVEWLLWLKAKKMLPDLPHVYDRQEHGRAVAQYGYQMLCTFARLVGLRADLFPGWDISRVERGQSEQVDIWEELLDDAAGAIDADDRFIVLDHDGWRYVRPAAFVEWVRKNRSGEDLPGGAQAVSRYLRERYGAAEFDGRRADSPALVGRRRCVRWPLPSND
jgi:hypothetical protein